MIFQVFQLTALVICGPSARSEKVIINPDRVSIKEEEVRVVLLCVQYFVCIRQFTQRIFFSECGLTTLSESVANADSITSSPVYASWSIVETVCASQAVTDLRACCDRVVLRHRTAKDTIDRWYHGGNSRSKTASRPGVQFSNVVGGGRVDFVPVASAALGPSGPGEILSFPSKGKIKISWRPKKFPRKFDISSAPISPQRQSGGVDAPP